MFAMYRSNSPLQMLQVPSDVWRYPSGRAGSPAWKVCSRARVLLLLPLLLRVVLLLLFLTGLLLLVVRLRILLALMQAIVKGRCGGGCSRIACGKRREAGEGRGRVRG